MPKLKRFAPLFSAGFAFLLLQFSLQSGVYGATGKNAMVATAHSLATDAALEVLRQGGNAVDAAVAAQWVLNAAEPFSSGIGGGGFFLYYEAASKRIYAFDGRERAPEATVPTLYLDEKGEVLPYIPDRVTGGHSVGVPGTLKLLKTVHERFGSELFFFASLFEPAIAVAENGFSVSARFSKYLGEQQERLGLFEASRKIFFKENGQILQTGDLLIQPDLAQTFRLIQREGIRVFYEGEIAEDIMNCVRNAPYRPGRMALSDLLYYEVIGREAIHGNYRGYDIFSMGPPSSGGTTLVETLQILEQFDLQSLGRGRDFAHVFSESQKLAFQDRNTYLGDPDFSEIPLFKILSKDFAKKRFRQIKIDQVLPPTGTGPNLSGAHTSHISIVDLAGNMVAYTTTIEHVFGSAMVVPGRGFLLNNELSDFDAMPWREEKQMRPNAPESEKRPLSSMTPTFVFHEGKPLLIVGSPGGSTIIGTVLNILVNVVDFKMGLAEALGAPRIINRDGAVELEEELFNRPNLREFLEKKGHVVESNSFFGNAQAIYFDPQSDVIIGESDPRGEGQSAGF